MIFAAKNFNSIEYRYVDIGLRVWIPLEQFFTAIGVTPQQLRDVFFASIVGKKRRGLRGWHWFGFNKKTHEFVSGTVPLIVESYTQLGAIPLVPIYFARLSKVLNKTLVLKREYDGEFDPYCTVFPNGKVVKNRVNS